MAMVEFPTVEDLVIAQYSCPDRVREIVSNLRFSELGPTLAYCILGRAHQPTPAMPFPGYEWPIIRHYKDLLRIGTLGAANLDNSWEPKSIELCWLPMSDEELLDARWEMFANRFDRAAQAAGFGAAHAGALTAAMGEMVVNVLEHSGRAAFAFAGYAFTEGRFEYVVVDTGIGILASLSSCAEYAHVIEAAEAIDLAVQPGVSRFGKRENRGTGFNTVVKSLTRLYGSIRVHSDDHCVILEGESPTLSKRRLRQTFVFKGVMVSVAVTPQTIVSRRGLGA